MAQDVTLDLGTFEISNDVDRKLVLAVATSMSLSLPAGHAGDPTAAQLREQVRAGSLWIARAGSCNFELGINFHSLLDDGLREGLERMVIGAFESFPVREFRGTAMGMTADRTQGWNVLGLEPRREFNSFCDLPDPAIPYSYSIQHIRPNSGLVAPDHVSCAYLSKLSCNLFFEIMGNMAQTIQKQALDQPKKVKTTTLRLPFRKPRRFTKRKPTDDQHEHQYSGRRKRPRMLASNTSPPRLQEAAVDEPELYSLAPELQEIRLESLTHVALNSLFGLKKRFSGVRLTGRAKFPTLLDLTPAVWNARYFQVRDEQLSQAALSNLLLGSCFPDTASTVHILGSGRSAQHELVDPPTKITKPGLDINREASEADNRAHPAVATYLEGQSHFADQCPIITDRRQHHRYRSKRSTDRTQRAGYSLRFTKLAAS